MAPQRPAYDKMRTVVVIPTYNEAANLDLIITRLHDANPAVDALVVDDGSPDGTGKIADLRAENDGRVHVLHRTAKAGLGAAYVAGFGWALEHGYDVVVEMDADGSHAPEQLSRLLAALVGPGGVGSGQAGAGPGGADVVLGSRWVKGGEVRNWPLRRKVLSRGGNVYTRIALGIDLRDATGGFRAYRRAVLEAIDLDAVSSQGYCFQVDLAWRAAQRGFRIVEVPITFVERERGESKMGSDIVREALLNVTRWGWDRRRGQLLALRRRLHG